MEEVVFSLIDQVIENMDVCKCERCTMDVAAIALNHLPPKYVNTDQGELYSKVNAFKSQFEVDVISEITRAAMIVGKKPQH